MKLKNFLMIMMAVGLSLTSCSGKKDSAKTEQMSEGTRIAVAYFSATGTTKSAAERLAKLSGGDLIEIAPEQPYSDPDLDWRDSLSRSSIEMKDLKARPGIAGTPVSLEKYDIVLLGYPNWWNTAPRIINTFIEASFPEGKIVAPFMTSGGSDIIQSEQDLKKAYPQMKWKEGLLMNDVTDEDITTWIEKVRN